MNYMYVLKSKKDGKCKKISVDGCACPSVAFLSVKALASAEAKAGGFTPLDMKLSNGVNVRIDGKEEDYKVIHK